MIEPRFTFLPAWLVLPAAFLLAGCFSSPNDSGDDDDDQIEVPDGYFFTNDEGESTVVYGGQTVRLLLLHDIQSAARVASQDGYTGGALTDDDILQYYQHVDTDSLDIRSSVTPAPLHTKYAQITANRSLHDKISEATVIGYGVTTDSLVRRWAATIAANSEDAEKRGTAEVHLDSAGVDLSQMLSKTLGGAVAYYQATGVYLDLIPDDDNTAPSGSNNYTEMEHHWDEAFGYFGAARDYLTNYTDDDLAGAGTSYKDTDNDGSIDFTSEVNFSMMGRYTGRRDLGISGQDWSGAIFRAFVKGRAFISAKGSMDSILAQRDTIAGNGTVAGVWEKVFAANTVHYIHGVREGLLDTTVTRASLGNEWGEMKAFAISLQYNPFKKITDTELETLHGHLGLAPERTEGYAEQLDSALALVKDVYGFRDEQIDAF